jgi:UTP--glucose-1-phosphate uridylyltransferase
MINKCLFPVAGYGSRFLPATKAMPKEILPILDKPLVQYGVEEAQQAGLTDMAFVTGRGKRAIEDHFDINYELEHQIAGSGKEQLLSGIRKLIEQCTFSYIRQVQMRGLGDAILKGRPLIGDQAFAVVLVDDLCFGDGDGVLQQMVALHERFGCSIVAIEEVPEDQTQNYGVIAGELIADAGPDMQDRVYQITDMVEKPQSDAPSNLAIIGRYILTPDIFEIIENTPPGANGELQITDALRTQAA